MKNNAWLLTANNGQYFAVSDVEMVEYMPTVFIHPVPVTPGYCKHVLLWRDLLLPVVNFALLFDSINNTLIQQVGIFAYQVSNSEALYYVAIALQQAPTHIRVNDQQFCELPSYYTGVIRPLALSCFLYKKNAVPIIDITYLCSSHLRDNITITQS